MNQQPNAAVGNGLVSHNLAFRNVDEHVHQKNNNMHANYASGQHDTKQQFPEK